MERKDILIIEDDSTLSEALRKYFEVHKLKVHTAPSGIEARKLLESHPIALVLMDCLLPDGSGVDLATQLRRTYNFPLNIVLMSGIFVDQAFIKESLRSTQAIAFLKKPFDVKDLEEYIPQGRNTATNIPVKQSLYQIFRKEKMSAREKRRAMEALEEIHGFDLPFVYSILVESKASGYLNIASQDGKVYGVTFAQGSISQVDFPDEQSFLGAILLDKGFIDHDDLRAAVAVSEGGPQLKLGQKLLQACVISPHALDLAMSEQMHIRLSKTIVDQQVKLNFVEADVERVSPSIDGEIFNSYLHEWIASKMTRSWLSTHFVQWLSSPIDRTSSFTPSHSALSMPLVAHNRGLIDKIAAGTTISQLIDSKAFVEDTLFKALYFLAARGLIVFRETKSKPQERLKAYMKIFEQIRGKNKLEIYEVLVQMTGVREDQADVVLREFSKILGSEPSGELKPQYQQLVRIAEEAVDFVRKGNVDKIKKELSKDDLDLKLKAATQYEEAKSLLHRSQFRPAFELLRKAMSVDPSLPQIKLHWAWAKLSIIEPHQERTQVVADVEMDLLQVPPEEKTNALYHFVMGLSLKNKGDRVLARKQFEKALNMDPQLVVARRELNFLMVTRNEKKDVFNRDLKDLVGTFFGKKAR